jgi:hypothetical protein
VSRTPGDKGRPILAALLALASVATLAAPKGPQEYLDEDTAATVTVVGEPLVFACPHPELAANVRDYLTLAAGAVNRNGKLTYVLIGYYWSTLDPRLRHDPQPPAEPLTLQADDRRIQLTLGGRTAHEAGIGMPVHAPPGSNATPNVYGVDLATLRFIGEARHLTVVAESGGTDLTYDLWEDRRPALRAFVRHMNGED